MAKEKKPWGCIVVATAAAVAGVLVALAIFGSDDSIERRDGGPDRPINSSAFLFDPAPPPPQATQLLGGLRKGRSLLGWTVSYVSVLKDKRLEVRFEKDMQSFAVWLYRKDTADAEPPEATEKYSVFFGSGIVPPDSAFVDGTEVQAVMAEVLKRVRENEARTPAVPGM